MINTICKHWLATVNLAERCTDRSKGSFHPQNFHTPQKFLFLPKSKSNKYSTKNHQIYISQEDPTEILPQEISAQIFTNSTQKKIIQKMGPLSQPLLLVILTALFSTIAAAADNSNLVFKGCADQNFQDSGGTYKQALKNLLDTLITQSSAAKFYKTTSGSPPSSITGLFQCRGDLSNEDCNRCVKRTPDFAQKLCGGAIAARVQLGGCYLRYEIAGFRQVSGTELLYKVCGSTRASGAGFGDRLELGFEEIVKGVGSGNGGYYAAVYQSVYVLGQCEGDLGGGDCVNCVKNAIDRAKSECGSSISAQIYLQRCYISYSYNPRGVPADNQQPISPSSGTGKINTEKIIAIVLGGLVGVGLVMACLLFTKSAFKKKTHSHKYGG